MGLQLLTGDKAEFGEGGVWRWKGEGWGEYDGSREGAARRAMASC